MKDFEKMGSFYLGRGGRHHRLGDRSHFDAKDLTTTA